MELNSGEDSGEVQIDDTDKQILKTLDGEGRIPLTELAEKVGLSHETVRYRVQKLEEENVIENYSARIDHKKLGYEILASIMIGFRGSEERWQELFDYLDQKREVVSVAKITGDYDLKLGVMAKSTEEFDVISREIKTDFSGEISEWETFIFINELKWKETPL